MRDDHSRLVAQGERWNKWRSLGLKNYAGSNLRAPEPKSRLYWLLKEQWENQFEEDRDYLDAEIMSQFSNEQWAKSREGNPDS